MTLFLKFLVALLLVFTPFSFAATEPWAFSVLQGLLFAAWTLWLITHREIYYPSLFKPVAYVFAVLVVIALVQSLFPQTLLDAVSWLHPITLMRLYTLEHACLFVTYLSIVLLTIQLFPSFDEVKQLLGLVVVNAVLVELCALCFPHGEYIAKLTGVTKYSAAVGPFVNRNHAGMFFVLASLASLGIFFTSQLRYRLQMGHHQRNAVLWQQIILGVITGGLLISTVFTRSRGAMLSLLAGLFSYAFLCAWCVPDKLKKRLKGVFITLVLLILASGWIYTHIPEINEFAHRSGGASAEIRQMMYVSAEKLLKQYPLWGIGIGALPVAIPSYTAWDVHSYIERLHNDWLEITVGIGGIGACLVLLGLIWFACKALNRLKRLETRKQFLFASILSALLAMSCGSLVDFHFFIPGCALVFFVLLGTLLAPTFHKRHVHVIGLPILVRILVWVLLVSSAWIPLQKTRCWRQFRLGSGLKVEGKLAAYEQGLTYYAGPRYALRLALAYYQAGTRSKDELQKRRYLELAYQTAQTYLKKYPKDKELSRMYIRAHRALY